MGIIIRADITLHPEGGVPYDDHLVVGPIQLAENFSGSIQRYVEERYVPQHEWSIRDVYLATF